MPTVCKWDVRKLCFCVECRVEVEGVLAMAEKLGFTTLNPEVNQILQS